MVNCTSDFENIYVINGCSELFAAVWGSKMALVQKCCRLWILLNNIPVEIEAMFELK